MPADLINRLPYGGSLGFLETILPHLTKSYTIYGIAIDKKPVWTKNALNKNVTYIPISRYKMQKYFPKRLQTIIFYFINRNKILKDGCHAFYIHTPESAIPFLFCNGQVPVIYHQHGSFNPMTNPTVSWGKNLIFIKIYDLFYKFIYRRAKAIIAIDKECYNQAIKNSIL